MHKAIDMHNLAYRTGYTVTDVREAGCRLFDELSKQESDLTRMLVKASSSSGLDPHHVLIMLKVMAEDFRQPVEAATTFGENVEQLAKSAGTRLARATDAARGMAASVEVSSLRKKGAATAGRVREELESVNFEQLKDRAGKFGRTVVAKTRSLVNDNPAASRPDPRENSDD